MRREWSIFPREDYFVNLDGMQIGIGLHPVWNAVPGAWNLLVLTHDVVDVLLPWEKDPGLFPVSTRIMPAVVGTAMQVLPDGFTKVGSLAEELRPTQFLEAVQNEPDLILTKCYGQAWLEIARDRAKVIEKRLHANVVSVDFTKQRVQ